MTRSAVTCPRAVVERRTRRGGSAGDAQREVERVEMAAAHVERTAVIAGRPDQCAGLLTVHEADVGIAVAVLEIRDMVAGARDVACLMVDMEVAGRQVAGDVMGVDKPVEMGTGIQRKLPERAGIGLADAFLQPVLIAAHADMDLPAIAARCAPAEPLALDKDDAAPGAGEVECRGQPRIAAADDTDVGLDRAGQGPGRRHRLAGGGIPARRISVRIQHLVDHRAPR
jgi:hypothetical protein